MKQAVVQHLIAAFLALIVFFTSLPFVESIVRYSKNDGPAIEWYSSEVLTPVVRPGEMLRFTYTRQHLHQCPADLRRYILAENEDVIVRFPLIPGGGRTPEDEVKTVESSVEIPLTMDGGKPWVPGNYIYRMTAVRFCPDRIEYDVNVPDVRFRLEVS